jgi:hypothetical protein
MHVCTVRLAGQDQQTLRGGEFRVWRLEELPLYLQFSGHSNVMLLYDDSTVPVPGEPLPGGTMCSNSPLRWNGPQVKDAFIRMKGVAGRSVTELGMSRTSLLRKLVIERVHQQIPYYDD